MLEYIQSDQDYVLANRLLKALAAFDTEPTGLVKEEMFRLQNLIAGWDRRFRDRTGPWWTTYTGRRFYPLDPRPGDFDILDIAHHLSLINRFNGGTTYPYSVAQHSVVTSYIVEDPYQREALLHDAAEAYLGDITRPIKALIGSAFSDLEDRVMDAIAKQFRLDQSKDAHYYVKVADDIALATEVRDLVPSGFLFHPTPQPSTFSIKPLPYGEAQKIFLDRYLKLFT